MRQWWADRKARKAIEAKQIVTKGGAEKTRKKRKIKALPGTAYKKLKEATNTLMDQLQALATSGSLGGVLATAGVATAASVAAVSSGLVDSIADRLPWTEPDADVAQVEQVETVAGSAVDQAMAAMDEAEQASSAVATVEAQLEDVPDNGDLEALRQELLGDIESLGSIVTALEQQVADNTATTDARLSAAETGTATALEQIAAIEIPDVSGIASNTAAVIEIQNELAVARAALNGIPPLRAAIESAEGLAVLARAEAGVAGDALDAVRADVAAQEQALGVADDETVAALAQAEEAFLLAQQNEARADQAIEQTEALQGELTTLGTDVAMAQATADAAATQVELDTAVQQAETAQAAADMAAVEALSAQAVANAVAADLTATQAEVEAAQAEAAEAAAAADMAQLAAEGAQVTADAAEVAASAAQADATTALDSIVLPAELVLYNGPPNFGTPATTPLPWTDIATMYDEVTITATGTLGQHVATVPAPSIAFGIILRFGPNDNNRSSFLPTQPNQVQIASVGLGNPVTITVTATGFEPLNE